LGYSIENLGDVVQLFENFGEKGVDLLVLLRQSVAPHVKAGW
jgi:hypothetical protein